MTKPPRITPIFDDTWFSMALRSIGDAVIATDATGRVLFMNPTAETLTGWKEEESRDRKLSEVFHVVNERTREATESPVEQLLREGQTGSHTNQAILVARGGRETPIDSTISPIADDEGAIAGMVLVFRDMTERRQSELLRARLAAVVESSDDIIITKTLDGIVTSWNRGAERVLGYTPEEVIGQHVSMLVPPDTIEDIEKILSRIRRGEKVDHYETRRRKKSGEVIDVSLTVSPILDSDGTIVGASKVGRDITLQKAIEQERLEADRRKDEFLAMLAHELRNPISSINSAVQLFGRLQKAEELEWVKGIIKRQVKNLARLIDDLLDVSRITRGKIVIRKELLTLPSVITSAVEVVRPLIDERKHELSISLGESPLQLRADPLRLEQMLVNLLTNAAKYTESGGKIWIEASREAEQVVVRVKDNGYGIPADLRPRIFDLFAQGDRSTARSEGGLGIGLTLVKSLAEMHEGTVTVESEGANRGSEFTLRLPAAEDVSFKHKVESTTARPPHASRRVLVVDDNIDSAETLARLLQLLGHQVSLSHDGVSAIESAKEFRPEVILLDIGLPGMDGYEVATALRADESCKNAVIVAVTGYGQEQDRRRSLRAGFDHHLIKPVEHDSLMAVFSSF